MKNFPDDFSKPLPSDPKPEKPFSIDPPAVEPEIPYELDPLAPPPPLPDPDPSEYPEELVDVIVKLLAVTGYFTTPRVAEAMGVSRMTLSRRVRDAREAMNIPQIIMPLDDIFSNPTEEGETYEKTSKPV